MEMNLLADGFEAQIRNLAQTFPYPPTPPIAGRVLASMREGPRRRWRALTPAWAWIAAVIVLLFAGLMAVPSVRAAVIEFIQAGAIRIFMEGQFPPTPTRPIPSQSWETEPPGGTMPGLPTPTPAAVVPDSILELEGEMTLEEAREKADFPILLPTYPPGLGEPDKVFYQKLEGGRGVFVVWFTDEQPTQLKMSLLLLGPGAFAGKGAPNLVEELTINGERAIWTEGNHFLILQTGPKQNDRVQLFVEGNVLIWQIDGITYRLEGYFDMEEAIAIAESIQ